MYKSAEKNTKNLYKTISENCESLAILIIGISLFGFVKFSESINIYTIISGFLILIIARFVHIFFSSLFIKCSKSGKLNNIFKFIIWFSGLRGAMGK